MRGLLGLFVGDWEAVLLLLVFMVYLFLIERRLEVVSLRFLVVVLFGRVVEIAFGTLLAKTLHKELAGFPILLQVNKGAVLFFAGPAFEIPANFATIHNERLYNKCWCL